MPKEKKNIIGSKIKRQTFNFKLKRNFKHVLKYNILRKPSELSIENITESSKVIVEIGNNIITSFFFQIMLLLVGILLFSSMMFITFLGPTNLVKDNEDSHIYSNFDGLVINDYSMLTYGAKPNSKRDGRPDYSFYADVSYSGDYDDVSVTVDVFDDIYSNDVYLLDLGSRSSVIQSNSQYPIFKDLIKSKFTRQGYNFNYINLDDLNELSDDSIVILSTKNIPCEFIDENSLNNLRDILVSKDLVFVYIGEDFNKCWDAGANSIRSSTSQLGFKFNQNTLLPLDLSLKSGYYSATYGPSGSDLIYDSISYSNVGDSIILFVPNVIQTGWSTQVEVVNDVYKIINEGLWNKRSTSTQTYEFKRNETKYLFSNYFDGDSKHVKLVFTGYNDTVYSRKVFVFNTAYKYDGGVYVYDDVFTEDPRIYSPVFTDNNYPTLNYNFGSSASERFSPTYDLIKDGEIVLQDNIYDIQPGYTEQNFKLIYPELSPGNYLIRINDGSKTLTEGRMRVRDIVIVKMNSYKTTREVLDQYAFKILDDYGEKFDFGTFTVYLNGELIEKNGAATSFYDYKFLDDAPYVVIDFASLDPGDHELTFDFGNGVRVDVPLTKRQTGPSFSLEQVLMLFIPVVIIFLANKYRRPTSKIFNLDIPDFPPISRIKVSVKKNEVLELIESTNREYHWEFMPLTLEEIKNAFRKLTHNGKSVVIGEYNLQRLLDRLIVRGVVVEYLGHYGLKNWEVKSTQTINYLVMFRKLRDIFVNNAISFTNMFSSKECDTVMKVQGDSINIHIYTGDFNIISRSLYTAMHGTTFIIFENVKDLTKFSEGLYSSNDLVVKFRLELQANVIKLFTIDELIDHIKQVKG